MPTRATDGSAGYDMCTAQAVNIQPNGEDEILSHLSLTTENVNIPSNIKSTQHNPKLPVYDRVSSTEPKRKTMTHKFSQHCIGFCKTNQVIKDIQQLANDSIKVTDIGRDPILLSCGETATLPKKRMNKEPV